MHMLWSIGLVVGLGVIVIFAMRAGELFRLSVRDGQLLLVRGRIPGKLRAELHSIVLDTPIVQRGIIVAHASDGGARLSVHGDIDEGRAQQMRNVFQLYPPSHLQRARVDEDRNFGQLLGVTWLAWMLHNRD